ncbi:phospholipase C [Bradyrhizobium elkanii]|uniref:alkaline phosphatase family protein n=1 Tax=unclassified Bradyrhizobium TaxID=2631580 RepID=UPI0004B6E896|nr:MULTISPECIES: alkaline phosphatase family protein [Bradyrhizobium]MCS3445890.1 phospholipase C [Bradyrhizobium elkanii]MCS3562978.1 phospholipase C [Bradyrhizobium elkanii]MCW2147186.1 phospholipase C [Bradyrhizobium elkanii]MCW2353736.1 phospholipase C [Bradyrhizobium elkanii]MCW2380017.1 phospholipase C [Bradyrhizobium elkanii]
MSLNYKKHWRTSTALCIASTVLVATAAYAAHYPGGRSDWDKRPHHNHQAHEEGDRAKHENNGHHGDGDHGVKTASPIKHVIILIGENRGLDHTFGIYKPKGKGQTISNLLSKGIVNEDGTPGPNFAQAQQSSVAGQPLYYIGAPTIGKSPYNATNPMPQPNTAGTPTAQSDTGAPFKTIAEASVEKDMDPADLDILTTGFSGLPTGVLDTRIPGAGGLNGPFQLQGEQISDDDYTGDSTHRFYQDWQQEDCSAANATKKNNSGCLNDLFPFVMATYSASNKSMANSMGYYNAQQGQAPVLKMLADRFTLSDNFHQSFHGGTGANHFMLGTGDAAFWSDGKGNPVTPPANLIANPNPVAGSVNRYTVDGNWSNCSDVFQPGVKPIVTYLNNLPYAAEPNCKPNHYYMLNNVNPGYLPNGALSGGNNVPPSSVRTIGDALMEKNISWAFYGGAFNDAVALSNAAVAANPSNPNLSAAAVADPAHALGVAYCQICNPFQYATSIMANPAVRQAHMKDTADLITAIQNNTLPAVSFGKPDGLLDGHPQSSKVDLFEAYVLNVLNSLDNNPELKAETAVFITWDEAGGYWDSGYQQSIDFFGDGPRIPTLILSPYSTGGKVNHNYADHVSLLKFIERNWALQPLTNRSRDNLPNPSYSKNNEYVPTNSPALSDMFDAFDFSKPVTLSYTE